MNDTHKEQLQRFDGLPPGPIEPTPQNSTATDAVKSWAQTAWVRHYSRYKHMDYPHVTARNLAYRKLRADLSGLPDDEFEKVRQSVEICE